MTAVSETSDNSVGSAVVSFLFIKIQEVMTFNARCINLFYNKSIYSFTLQKLNSKTTAVSCFKQLVSRLKPWLCRLRNPLSSVIKVRHTVSGPLNSISNTTDQ